MSWLKVNFFCIPVASVFACHIFKKSIFSRVGYARLPLSLSAWVYREISTFTMKKWRHFQGEPIRNQYRLIERVCCSVIFPALYCPHITLIRKNTPFGPDVPWQCLHPEAIRRWVWSWRSQNNSDVKAKCWRAKAEVEEEVTDRPNCNGQHSVLCSSVASRRAYG